jgi:hypothetical protein
MWIENRKYPRKDLDVVAHVELSDGPPVRCTLSDVSQGGARLTTSFARELPNEFTLLLPNRIRRWCRVAWRSNGQIGVAFTIHPRAAAIAPRKIAEPEAAPAWPGPKAKCPVLIRCAKTGRVIQTGIKLGTQDLAKLPDMRRFAKCQYCGVLHGWSVRDAWIPDVASIE